MKTTTKVTFTANQTHWYDILAMVLKTVASDPIIATIIPAPIEAGIIISAVVVGQVVDANAATAK